MTSKNTDALNKIRNQIDEIDNKIHDLIMKRAKVVADVAKEKRKNNKDNIVIYRPSREHEILCRLLNRHKGNFPEKALISLWRNLISAYISIQGELRITYYGNIKKIVNSHFGLSIKKEKKKTSTEVMKSIIENKADIAIFPYPNSSNAWWSSLIHFNNIYVVGSITNKFYGKPESLILSMQKVEYDSLTSFLYLVVLDLKDVKDYLKFIKSKGYLCIAEKSMARGKVMIMISTKVNAKQAAESKLLTITNYKFNLDIGPKYIGVYGCFDKENINE